MIKKMATSAVDESEQLISCPICFETYKNPKCLPCLHTFCQNCLSTYITSCLKSKGKGPPLGFNCPVCRTFVSLPTEQSETNPEKLALAFPSNHLINSLIDQQKIIKREKLCEVCIRKDEEQKAVSWCYECEEAVCDGCVRTHKAVKSLRYHRIVNLGDFKSDQLVPIPTVDILCEKHKEKKLEIYCHDHKAVCCLTCMTTNHRKCDNVTTLEEAAEGIKAQAEDGKFMDRLKSLSVKMKEIADGRTENVKRLKTQKVEIEDSVAKQRAVVKKYFDELEMRLRHEFDSLHKETVTCLEEQRDQYEYRAQTLEKCHKLMKISLNRASDLQICVELNKIGKQLSDQELFLKTNSQEVQTFDYAFTVTSATEKLQTTMATFGKVTAESKQMGSGFAPCKPKELTFMHMFKVYSYIADGAFLSDGRLVITNVNSQKIQIYDCSGKLQNSFVLLFQPFYLTFIYDTKCVASSYNRSTLYFVDPVNNRQLSNITVNSLRARRYAATDNNIIAASVKDIKVLDKNGTLLKTLATSNGEIFSVCPTSDNKILYTDRILNKLHCIDMNGKQIFTYSDETMVCPTDVKTDNDGSIYLVGRMSHNIQILQREGKFIKTFLSEADGLHRPYFLAFNKDFTKMMVCCDMDNRYSENGGDYIKIFKTV